jgi:hypothetical protein
MKLLIASFLSLAFGVIVGWHFEHRHVQREMTAFGAQMVESGEAFDRLEAARGIRAIELIEAGDTNQAVEMFTIPIAFFYSVHRDLTHNDERTKVLLAKIEQFVQTNHAVAKQIKPETNRGEVNKRLQ